MDIQTYLTRVCQHTGLDETDVEISIEEDEKNVTVHVQVPQTDVGLFIGNRGETLASLQRMVRIVFHEDFADKHVMLNINDYREERQRQLEERAKDAAQHVLDSGRSYRFPYLSSYERFIVHSALSEDSEFDELESFSEGEGRERRLIIQPKSTA